MCCVVLQHRAKGRMWIFAFLVSPDRYRFVFIKCLCAEFHTRCCCVSSLCQGAPGVATAGMKVSLALQCLDLGTGWSWDSARRWKMVGQLPLKGNIRSAVPLAEVPDLSAASPGSECGELAASPSCTCSLAVHLGKQSPYLPAQCPHR